MYEVLGVGRDDGQEKGEMTALYFKCERFQKLESGHFWLSETPDIPGSKNWAGRLRQAVNDLPTLKPSRWDEDGWLVTKQQRVLTYFVTG